MCDYSALLYISFLVLFAGLVLREELRRNASKQQDSSKRNGVVITDDVFSLDSRSRANSKKIVES